MDSRQTEGEPGLATGPGMTAQYVQHHLWPPLLNMYYPPPLCPPTNLSLSPASPLPHLAPSPRYVDASVGSVNVVTVSLRGEVYTWPTAAHLLTRQPGQEALLQSVVLPVPAPAAPFIPTVADTLDPLPGALPQPPGQGPGPDGAHGNSAVGFSRPPSGFLPPAEPPTTTTTTSSSAGAAAAAGLSRPPSTLSRKFESSGALSRGGAGNLRWVGVHHTPWQRTVHCPLMRWGVIPLPFVATALHALPAPAPLALTRSLCSPPGRPLPPSPTLSPWSPPPSLSALPLQRAQQRVCGVQSALHRRLQPGRRRQQEQGQGDRRPYPTPAPS
jgi:hypothetical protein